ncbi:MAG: NADH:ubiquinone reductase (Na(+)-transporting) subunit D [Planctomycetes bacterium]|nr:NADH:ubiquinone reductase (Na(+)-transporting) subunit D [Planctomycetota bacterium]
MTATASKSPAACGPCAAGLLCDGKAGKIVKDGVWANNPISIQVLGICSALAVTNKLANALVMGGALIFVTACSSLFLSFLRNATPRKIRMIAEVAIISTFVIVFDQLLRAFYWDMSKQLGPYVGLIITNCIVMGRAEAFALQNRPIASALDGIANGLGYAIVLAVIAVFREMIGAGKLLGFSILDKVWYEPNQLMILAPGAFFTLGILIALLNALRKDVPETKP